MEKNEELRLDEPGDLLRILDDSGKPILRITQTAIMVNPDVDVNDAAQIVIKQFGDYIYKILMQNVAGQITQLQSTCWQLQQQRDAVYAELQALKHRLETPQKLDS